MDLKVSKSDFEFNMSEKNLLFLDGFLDPCHQNIQKSFENYILSFVVKMHP